MVNAINNVNFKSVIITKYPPLSDSQEKVVRDIQTKLGDKAEKKHFLITPLKDDVVELSQVYNVKNTGSGIDKKVQYSDPLFIGRYNEEHPFEIDDLKTIQKEQLKSLLGVLAPTVLIIGIILISALGLKKQPQEQSLEKITTMAKDSMQTLKQDTFQITKDSLKMFK